MRIGPPRSKPKERTEERETSSVTVEPSVTIFSRGPSKMPGVTLPKIEPWNWFDPFLVRTSRVPPVERPYSGM